MRSSGRITPKSLGTTFALAILALLVTGGCGSIVRRLARHVGVAQVERVVKIPNGGGNGYAKCFGSSGGSCMDDSKTPVGELEFDETVTARLRGSSRGKNLDDLTVSEHRVMLVDEVLKDRVHEKLVDLHNGLLHRSSSEQLTLEVTDSEFGDYLEKLENASLADGWCEVSEGLGPNEKGDVLTNYLCSYFRAYFRNGRFAQMELETSKVLERLKERFPGLSDDEIKQIYAHLFGDGSPKSVVFGQIGEMGLVTRAGATYQFPAIEAKVVPLSDEPFSATEIDFLKVGTDLVRVFWEATFDAHDRLPGVSNATGVRLQWQPLDAHDPKKQTSSCGATVNAEEFGAVQELANQTEGWVAAGLGRLIRGAGPVALNNEAIATLLETIVGSIVRKLTEKAAWCVFSCGICDIPQGGSPTCPTLFAEGELVELTILVKLGEKPPEDVKYTPTP